MHLGLDRLQQGGLWHGACVHSSISMHSLSFNDMIDFAIQGHPDVKLCCF